MFFNQVPVTARSPVIRYRIWLVVIFLFMVFPFLLSAADLIDKTMPATIPAEIVSAWKDQDNVSGSSYTTAINDIIKTLKADYKTIVEAELDKGATEKAYLTACHYRRVAFLEDYAEYIKKMVYAKHHNIGSLIVGCQEGFSNGFNRDEKWKAGAALYYLDFTNYYPQPKLLIEDKSGIIRDPCVSLDGKKVAFAWYKNASNTGANASGYKIFELDLEKQLANSSTAPRQVTYADSGLVFSDYEPCYTPFGEIIFNSSRCFQLIDCFENMVSTFYAVDTSGKYLRRIGYDQVHDFYPQLRSDGRIMYTRWEYNDRNLMQSMGLFTMRADGTEQTEYYGNQTEWPVTVIHGREIPFTQSKKVMAIASGHHAPYYGEPLIIDIGKGRNGLTPLSSIAPFKAITAKPTDHSPTDSGGVEFKWAFPLPLDENRFFISYTPTARGVMKIYAMAPDGHKELIAWDASVSVSQIVPVITRDIKATRSDVDYKKTTGVFKMENVYVAGGRTLQGVQQGSIKKIRVNKIEYRHSGPDVNPNKFGREGAMGWVYIPISRYTGSWQAKRIIGEAPVYSDGSAAFEVPAMQPLFFQLIDADGRMIQTMRSWSTLMPGETFNCIGCHEDKNSAIPDPTKRTEAGEAKPLEPFYDISGKLFRYTEIIQPILDKKCVKCHNPGKLDLTGTLESISDDDHSECKKKFARSYINLTKGSNGFMGNGTYITWLPIFSANVGIAPKQYGSMVSKLTKTILPNHKSKEGFELTKEESDKICAWIDLCIPHWGLYNEGYSSSSDSLYYDGVVKQRNKHEGVLGKNIEAIIKDKNGLIGEPTKVVFGNGKSTPAVQAERIPMKFVVSQRRLIVIPLSTGELKINDLCGRQLTSIRIGKNNVGTSMSIPIAQQMSKGVYIARLLEGNQIQTCKISILR